MASYVIARGPTAVAIELTEIGGNQQQLLEAFQDCAEGRCSCPTDEYDKVASMQISGDGDRIDIRLEAKPGRDFDARQIARCLDHSLAEAPADVRLPLGHPHRQPENREGDQK